MLTSTQSTTKPIVDGVCIRPVINGTTFVILIYMNKDLQNYRKYFHDMLAGNTGIKE